MPLNERDERCELCRCWVPTSRGPVTAHPHSSEGECRRYPPLQDETWVITGWNQWCFEFRQIEDSRDAG